MSIVARMAELPSFLTHEGVEFTFAICNDLNDITICYFISGAKKKSPHFEDVEFSKRWENPFTKKIQNHLYIKDNVKNDDQLEEALAECKQWLIKNKLL